MKIQLISPLFCLKSHRLLNQHHFAENSKGNDEANEKVTCSNKPLQSLIDLSTPNDAASDLKPDIAIKSSYKLNDVNIIDEQSCQIDSAETPSAPYSATSFTETPRNDFPSP